MGRPAGRRLGHAILAPQHPEQSQAAPASLRPASTAEEAVERLSGLIPRERILVVTGEGLADRLRESLHLPADNVLVEPRAASTAPALIWATWEAWRRDPDAEVLSLHADWAVGDAAAFRHTADLALGTARTHDRLVTVGIVPSRPETGYGYIVPGDPLDESARTVARFSEKPDAATALDLMAAGALWNSGLFAWTADRLLDEVARHTPEVAAAPRRCSTGATSPASSERSLRSRSTSGLLERSGAVAVVTGAFAWDDVGTWAGPRPGSAQGSQRQRRRRPGVPPRRPGLHRLVGAASRSC